MGVIIAATLWGLAEATVFFIVPDVLLSVAGLFDMRKALVACLYALLGALVGGVIMYNWGVVDLAGTLRVLDMLPSISVGMMYQARADMGEHGLWAVITGPMMGVPYKIYAAQAPAAGIGITAFLLMSIPARLIRFVALTVLLPYLTKRVVPRGSMRHKVIALLGGWAAFYLYYFLRIPN